MNSSVVISHLV